MIVFPQTGRSIRVQKSRASDKLLAQMLRPYTLMTEYEEKRAQAYLNLISALLTCSSEMG